jgi:hypothetical protein
MDKIELQSLRQELADCDCLEAQRRELLYSRRWFVRTLAGAALGAAVFGRAGVALANESGCNANGPNNCYTENECQTPGGGDACNPNVCTSNNTCGKPGGSGPGAPNTCYTSNTCSTDTCGANPPGGNTCVWYNYCGAQGNVCSYQNQCSEWNECLLANACKTTNTCTVRNKCDGTVNNIPPCSASDTCPSGNTCSFMDWPCYWCNTCDAPG